MNIIKTKERQCCLKLTDCHIRCCMFWHVNRSVGRCRLSQWHKIPWKKSGKERNPVTCCGKTTQRCARIPLRNNIFRWSFESATRFYCIAKPGLYKVHRRFWLSFLAAQRVYFSDFEFLTGARVFPRRISVFPLRLCLHAHQVGAEAETAAENGPLQELCPKRWRCQLSSAATNPQPPSLRCVMTTLQR